MKTPLWLPTGSVRAILALAFSAALIFTAIVKGDVPPDLAALGAAVVAFYFGTRVPAK